MWQIFLSFCFNAQNIIWRNDRRYYHVELAHSSLSDWKDIFIIHLIIIIKSEVSTFPIVVIFFRGCVSEMVVLPYSVIYYIYISGTLGLCAVMHVGIANLRWMGETFPAFPAHAQPTILSNWQEVHGSVDNQTSQHEWVSVCQYSALCFQSLCRFTEEKTDINIPYDWLSHALFDLWCLTNLKKKMCVLCGP